MINIYIYILSLIGIYVLVVVRNKSYIKSLLITMSIVVIDGYIYRYTYLTPLLINIIIIILLIINISINEIRVKKFNIKKIDFVTLVSILAIQILAIIKFGKQIYIIPNEDSINYIRYITWLYYGNNLEQYHSSIYFLFPISQITLGDVNKTIFIILFLHFIIIISLLLEFIRLNINLRLLYMFFPPIILGFKLAYSLYTYNLSVFNLFWNGLSFGIPFYNLPYPFLLETFKVSMVSSLLASIYLLEESKWKYLALLLSFLTEPEVLILLLIIFIIASKNKEIFNTMILGFIVCVYPLLHSEVLQNLNEAFNFIVKINYLFLVLLFLLVIVIKFIIHRLNFLDKISQFFSNDAINYFISLNLLILIMLLIRNGFSQNKILPVSYTHLTLPTSDLV